MRRILRKADGRETLLEKSESVVPIESIGDADEEDEASSGVVEIDEKEESEGETAGGGEGAAVVVG